ncbi:aftiphilin [Mugil cephalus]|uniref:aftiphilin n=1 Tax=Mugil cephalus TaxID=48193 RepID=UPI001FB8296E|nr:aftiphilin [Mugil cephalus]
MEPDIIPLHSSSPPPLDDDTDGEVGLEDDEFGDFGGFSVEKPCSPLGFADATEPCRVKDPVERAQPTSTLKLESRKVQEGQDCDAEPCSRLTNGYAERGHDTQAHSASIVGASSPQEETGFADFTVFTEQTAHPWCCGLSPMGNTEQWGGNARGTNTSLNEQICDSGQEVIMESEPRPRCENVHTKVKHCEKRDAALVQPHQDNYETQEAAAALDFPSGEEERGKDARREWSFNPLQTSKDDETEDRDRSTYELASEDLASLCDDLSFEGVSADLEPNVSSLASQDNESEWDRTDDEDEKVGPYRYSDSCVNSSMVNPSQSEPEKSVHCNQYATQGTSSTSNPTEDRFADFADSSPERRRDQEQTADAAVQSLGNLPPSDSFADFCSAPTQEDGEGSWAEFKDQSAHEEGRTWTQFREPVSSLQRDGGTEEEEYENGGSRKNSCQASLSCRVQQLLLATFPEVEVPAVEGEEELLSLCALLQPCHLPETKEAIPGPNGAQWIQQGLFWPQQDIHSAVGLQFQWGGSYTNRTLLRCLGVNTRNIVFVGKKKQPVTVPAFASDLGMLEPTKDSVPAVCSPRHSAVTTQAPATPLDTPDPSTLSAQEELPSSQLGWVSRGLSSSQDGTSPRRAPHFWGWK